jgi:hypothetical protein
MVTGWVARQGGQGCVPLSPRWPGGCCHPSCPGAGTESVLRSRPDAHDNHTTLEHDLTATLELLLTGIIQEPSTNQNRGHHTAK